MAPEIDLSNPSRFTAHLAWPFSWSVYIVAVRSFGCLLITASILRWVPLTLHNTQFSTLIIPR